MRPTFSSTTGAPSISSLLRSQSYLGAQYRRLRARLAAPKAITAMTHKLARLVYRMLKWGHEYVDKSLQYYEARHPEQQVHLLKKRAAKLGLQIVEPTLLDLFSRRFLESVTQVVGLAGSSCR
jgi:hypothetical protein